jgi:hypothetical protein
VLHVRRLFAIPAVFGMGLIVASAAAPARAAASAAAQAGNVAGPQSAPAPGGLGEMPLPGGLRAVLAAIDDRAAADRSQFLLEFIRRFYDTPIRMKSDPRDPAVRALTARLSSHQTGVSTGPPQTLPLPVPARIWIDVVFRGRATPETLAAEILQSRSASLLYYGLLSLDDATRAWIETQPDLITDLTERHPAAFAAAAPGLRIANAVLAVPGGEAAEPAWQALVGRRATEPAEFVRALVAQGGGRLAYFFGATAQLTPAQIRFALNLDAPTVADRVTASRRLYDRFENLGPGWTIEDRAFWRPSLDPVLLTADLDVDEAGRPILPGTRRFWSAVFADAGAATKDVDAAADAGNARAFAAGDPVDLAWLCEQVFRGPLAAHRRRYQSVLFASRAIRRITPEDARDALDAVRAAGEYPALVAALERAKVTDVSVFAGAARRAARLAALGRGERAVRALAQFQGALAVVMRGALQGSVPAGAISSGVASLSEIDVGARGDYEGRVVRWLAGWMDSYQRQPARPASRAPAASLEALSEGDAGPLYENAPGALDDNVLRFLAGPASAAPRFVDWEGTRYRLDLAWAEMRRLVGRLGEHPRPYLSSALALVVMADALADAGVTRETLRREAGVLEQVAQALGWDGLRASTDVPARYREVASVLGSAAGDADVRRASRLAPALRLLADELLARGLLELTYASALGQPERAAMSAWEGARRHDFGLRSEAFGSSGAWQLPAHGSDSALSRGWRVVGSLLGLDVKLADLSLVRLSSKLPSTRPTLQETNRRVLIEAVGLVEPASLTEADRDTLVTAIRKGRGRLAAVRTPAEALALADEIRLGSARRTLLPWVIANEPERATAFLSPSELFWLGLGNTRVEAGLHAWGAPGEPRLGCLCLQLIEPRPLELLGGRWNFGMLASTFPDLNLRLAELLAELKMPAALLGPVLTSATLDLVETAASRDQDDRRGLVEFVQALGAARVEQYLALLTTDGPLVPAGEAAGTPAEGTVGLQSGVPR